MNIIKSDSLGFCSGVRRAITVITAAAKKNGRIETLGALVHNSQVIEKLRELNIETVPDIGSASGNILAVSAHGVSPAVLAQIKHRGLEILDTTCPFVKRAQTAARVLAAAGFFTIVYGEAEHPEVKGILGWTGKRGMATLDIDPLKIIPELPRRIGLVSQTTQVPSDFLDFANALTRAGFQRDSEIRIIDTICHETRKRQSDTLIIAKMSDLVLVAGGHDSANTRRLFNLCSSITDAHWIETALDIKPEWLSGKGTIGVTAGTSTDDETVNDIIRALGNLHPI
jgi:4-hydroxy-3-methylbut-2-enyl diphosphate reductase